MRVVMICLAFMSTVWAGVFLCVNNFPVLGGLVVIFSLLANWGFEKPSK